MIATTDLPTGTRRWGRWVEHDGSLCIPDGTVAYEVPIADAVEHPTTWIDRMRGKAWITVDDVADLCDALWEIASERGDA